MKKITSIILLLTIISSCFVFSGCDWEKIWGNDHQVEEVELNEELISNMKWDYLRTFDIKDVSHSGVLVEYCSDKLYNGYAVAMLDGCRHKPDGATENIGGVDFKYFDTNRIYAYKNGTFLTLEEAYSQEILTVEDLQEISDAYGSDHTYYHQVCDFFDWTKGHTAFDMEEDETRDRLLVVLFSGKDIPPKSFFEVQSKSGIKVSEIIDLREQHDAYKYYYSEYGDLYLELVFDKAYTFKELEIYAKRLVEKPGIYLAGTHPDFTYPAFDAVTEITDTDIWALDYINVEKLWHFTENLLFIDVGVVDTGIAEHIDISGVMSNDDETDFFHNSGICRDDPTGHGTFVAGIIGATANNDIGIDGVSQNVILHSLQAVEAPEFFPYGFSDINRKCPWPAVTAAINYASESLNRATNRIRILNISMGGHPYYTSEIEDTMDAILNYDGLVIFCAGNDSTDLFVYPRYPQSNNSTNMIVVGGLNRSGNIHTTSNYGVDTVDIYAPGMDIYSTLPNDTYGMDSGTSYAAPYVTGVAALLLSVKPDLTPAQLKECIVEGGDSITITLLDGSTEVVKKLNGDGALKYLFDHFYLTNYTVGTSGAQINDEVYLEQNYFSDSNSMIKITVAAAGDYSFTVCASDAIGVSIYDSTLNMLSINSTVSENEETITFSEYLFPGEYYVRADFGDAYFEHTVTYSISYSPHIHSFMNFRYKNFQYHTSYCDCGTVGGDELHAIRSTQVIGNTAPCISCGHMVLIDPVGPPGQIIHNIQKVSLNGSYILPNGVIVLVDEDVEAYLNGTLVFYDRDKLPEVE